MTNPDNVGGLIWYVCTSCLLMVQLASDTQNLGRCQCSPSGWSLRRVKLPKGYELCRAAPAGGDVFSASELESLAKCVLASVTPGGLHIPEGWNVLLDKLAAMQAKDSAPAGSGEVEAFVRDLEKADSLLAKSNKLSPEILLGRVFIKHRAALLRKLQQGADDPLAMLAFMLNNHATVETDGCGNWRVAYEWTSPPTYGPYAAGRYPAIQAAMIGASQDQEGTPRD